MSSKYGLPKYDRCESHSCESVESGRCDRKGELVRIFQGTTNNKRLNDGHWEQHSCEEAVEIDREQGFEVIHVYENKKEIL